MFFLNSQSDDEVLRAQSYASTARYTTRLTLVANQATGFRGTCVIEKEL